VRVTWIFLPESGDYLTDVYHKDGCLLLSGAIQNCNICLLIKEGVVLCFCFGFLVYGYNAYCYAGDRAPQRRTLLGYYKQTVEQSLSPNFPPPRPDEVLAVSI
jgi:hypothetical protein